MTVASDKFGWFLLALAMVMLFTAPLLVHVLPSGYWLVRAEVISLATFAIALFVLVGHYQKVVPMQALWNKCLVIVDEVNSETGLIHPVVDAVRNLSQQAEEGRKSVQIVAGLTDEDTIVQQLREAGFEPVKAASLQPNELGTRYLCAVVQSTSHCPGLLPVSRYPLL
jgi:hypothetical protein